MKDENYYIIYIIIIIYQKTAGDYKNSTEAY
jgi:hypothetical protein